MIKRAILIACLIFAASGASAESSDVAKMTEIYLKYGELNGRVWTQAYDDSAKVGYVMGFNDCIVFCSTLNVSFDGIEKDKSDKVLKSLQNFFLKVSPKELIEYFDKFYSDSANLDIPIRKAYAVMYYEYSNKGTPAGDKSKISEIIIRLRTQYSQKAY